MARPDHEDRPEQGANQEDERHFEIPGRGLRQRPVAEADQGDVEEEVCERARRIRPETALGNGGLEVLSGEGRFQGEASVNLCKKTRLCLTGDEETFHPGHAEKTEFYGFEGEK